LLHHILTTHSTKPDVIVGLDARGFLLGPILALRLGAAFVPVRKGGKLPGQVQVAKYEKEYGIDEFEMQAGAVQPGQKCIVVE
jgi:adenine phosphoribosyltransferase